MMRRFREPVLLAAALAAALLPAPVSFLLLLAAALSWLRLPPRPPRREAAVGWLLAVAAALALAGAGLAALEARLSDRAWLAREALEYARIWEGLRSRAAAAAAALAEQPGSPLAALDRPLEGAPAGGGAAAMLTAFDRLGRLAGRHEPDRDRRDALLLIDRDGNPVAWAGDGLIQEPEQWPRSGLAYRAGFSSVSLYAAEPLDESDRPWRVVAGASFPTRRLPRPAAAEGAAALSAAGLGERLREAGDQLALQLLPARRLRWSLADNPAQTHPGTLEARAAGAPSLEVERLPATAPEAPAWPGRVAWGGLAAALLALAVMRGVGAALPTGSTMTGRAEHPGRSATLVLAGLFALGGLADVGAVPLAALEAGVALALAGLLAPRWGHRPAVQQEGAGGGRVLLAGAGSVLALAAAAWAVQRAGGPFDVAEDLMVPAGDWCIRAAWSAAAFGLFLLAGRRAAAPGSSPSADRWIALAVGLLLAGAAAADTPWLALPLLAAGGACAARFADRQRRGQPAVLAVVAVLAALGGAAIWETAYRAQLARYDLGALLGKLAPPAPADVTSVGRGLEEHFAHLDLGHLVARSPVGLDEKDLAYSLWRDSPLARPNALSALTVRSGNSLVSSFSFGLPLDGEGGADPRRLHALQLPGWEPLAGEAPLRLADGRPGVVRYWLLPRPGFRARGPQRLMHIESGLLRGGVPSPAPAEDLAAPGLFALFGIPDGRAVLSPWPERPPLAPRLRRPHPVTARVETPAGRARAYVRPLPTGDAWEAVYLPDEDPLTAVERTANWAVGLLLLLACAAPAAALVALPRAAFRGLLRRTVRSYSRRLLAVYTLLLIVPLLALNALLVRSVENDMLQRQREYGQVALTTAAQLLGDAIRALPVGFVFDPGTFDARLTDISEVVHRPVNLYGRSRLSASSEHELFTAGLLPGRLPGEVYSSLALGDRNLYALVNHAAEIPYLELYAPLRLAGDDPGGEPRLFLSVPLLAQQDEASRQLAHLRRHAILVTAALFALLAAVGSRLAQNFTRPITQLVEGTRRIAAGARSLDLAPTELELAALVAAIDDMARRIAEGREGLLREKQVVERVVQNIASGVVSLDRERRVLMHNRVAAELLGVAPGQSLERLVGGVERLAPVAAFLRSAGGGMAQATVRLSGAASGGGGAGGEREWSLAWVPLAGPGEPSALLVVEDATEELRGQRLLAWAEMARMIAHEIKNPLTPIRLSAEHMREVHQRDPRHFDAVFERCTANILAQVEELRAIASEFSTYSAIPRIDPRPGDLAAAVAELAEGYRAAPPRGIAVDLELPDGPIAARFDAKLLSRAVRNLIENALRASAGGGRVVVRVARAAGVAGDSGGRAGAAHGSGAADGAGSAGAAGAAVSGQAAGGGGGGPCRAVIAVLDSGPGVAPELLPRIFDPYFSTHDTGTGLGLPIARRIAEEHGGTIEAHNRPGGGLEAVITLPCLAPDAPPPASTAPAAPSKAPARGPAS